MLNAVVVVVGVAAAGLDAQQESETFQIIFLSLCCHQHGTKFDSSFWLKATLIIQSHFSEVLSKFEEPDNTGSFTDSTVNYKKTVLYNLTDLGRVRGRKGCLAQR